MTVSAVQTNNLVPSKGIGEKILDTVLPRNAVTKKREFHIIPESIERALSTLAYPTMIQREGGYFTERRTVDMVRRIGNQLARVSDRPDLAYQFEVINNSHEINAWSMPNGKIAIYSGLIKKLEQETDTFGLFDRPITLEEKIAVVLGHEITHAAARHVFNQKTFEIFLRFIFAVVQWFFCICVQAIIIATIGLPQDFRRISQSAFSSLEDMTFTLATKHLERSKEYEADRYGMVYMHRAGYDAKVAVWLQELFSRASTKTNIFLIDQLQLFEKTHPFAEDRTKCNRKTLEEIQNGTLR